MGIFSFLGLAPREGGDLIELRLGDEADRAQEAERLPRKHGPAESDQVRARAASAETSGTARALAGGRVSFDQESDPFTSALSVFSPLSSDEYWRTSGLDTRTLDKVPATKLIELLADVSPDVSRALWDYLLFCNPGWKALALKPGTETEDPRAKATLDQFLGNLNGPFVSTNVTPVDVVFASMFIGPFLRGGLLAELVLDGSGRTPLDVAVPDPATLRFRRVVDPVRPERGKVWQVGQLQNSQFVPLDRPTVVYVPLHPMPGKPYGRPLASPALFSTLFLIGLLHDLRRVVAQQGYPRLDIEIDFEKLKDAMPPEAQSDPEAFEEWVRAVTQHVERHYAALQPDDAYVHGSPIKVNKPVGAVDARSLGAVEGIIKALERQAMRALKSTPLLFGLTEGASEANANRQWEIHVAGIKAMQHLVEFALERLLTLALQAQGLSATVKFRFAELRAAELLRDAQVRRLDGLNAAFEYDRGWCSQDAAALRVTGHKADVPEPRNIGSTAGANVPVGGVQADPGSER